MANEINLEATMVFEAPLQWCSQYRHKRRSDPIVGRFKFCPLLPGSSRPG